jgi:hypothetical chaperone protein
MLAACGIDFGTSNSTVGWSPQGKTALLPLEDEKITLPSVVFFNAEEEVMRFGRAALSEYLMGYEGRLMRSLKSLLGSGLMDGSTEVGGRSLPFRVLLQKFIGELKQRAEHSAGQAFQHVVVGRPVFFVDNAPEADQLAEDTLHEIVKAAGFKDVIFQYEPIAAAFDYESNIQREELVAVVDIGGGTSDFSLIRLSPERAKKNDRKEDILASGGIHIGGTDFDKHLSLNHVMPLLGMGSSLKSGLEVPSSYYFNLATWHTINLLYTQRTWTELKDVYRQTVERESFGRLLNLVEQREGHWLALHVEECKIALSQSPTALLNLERLTPPETLPITRESFHASVTHLVISIKETLAHLLQEAGLKADNIDTVFFTGGASGVSLLREEVGSLFPLAKHVEGDLFGSIGTGLALDARRKFG